MKNQPLTKQINSSTLFSYQKTSSSSTKISDTSGMTADNTNNETAVISTNPVCLFCKKVGQAVISCYAAIEREFEGESVAFPSGT